VPDEANTEIEIMGVVTVEQIKKHFEDKRDQYKASGFQKFYEDAHLTVQEIDTVVAYQLEENGDACENILEDVKDREMRKVLDKATDRKGFAYAAMNIPQDRYSAGSNAARVAIYIMLKCGTEAALNFVKDLEHHES
jgi:hypothetical protein